MFSQRRSEASAWAGFSRPSYRHRILHFRPRRGTQLFCGLLCQQAATTMTKSGTQPAAAEKVRSLHRSSLAVSHFVATGNNTTTAWKRESFSVTRSDQRQKWLPVDRRHTGDAVWWRQQQQQQQGTGTGTTTVLVSLPLPKHACLNHQISSFWKLRKHRLFFNCGATAAPRRARALS